MYHNGKNRVYIYIKAQTLYLSCDNVVVLGLARTGLIFTGLQEGAQPGGGG